MKPKNAIMLLSAALIWGIAFVAQSVGMDYMGPFTFNGLRSLIGGVVLLPCIAIFSRGSRKDTSKTDQNPGTIRDLVTGGLLCGLILFAATTLQQIGILYTSVGKCGFITAFYIVMVPVFGIFLGKKTGWRVWLAVVIALAGLYFLCITERFTIGRGDILIFLCAILFAVHILVIDHFSPKVDGVKLSCIQFFTCGLLSLPFMFLLETPTWGAVFDGIVPLLYAGVLSCGVAYTLQIIGQRNVNPAIASLLLSLESCFSVLGGWLILGQQLSGREAFGCVLMFAAIILAQLPVKSRTETV